MKDLIIVCSTCDSAKKEFDRFLQFFGDIIVKRSNKYRRMITLNSGAHIVFMFDKGNKIIATDDFHVCSLQEFKQIMLDITEELNQEAEVEPQESEDKG